MGGCVTLMVIHQNREILTKVHGLPRVPLLHIAR